MSALVEALRAAAPRPRLRRIDSPPRRMPGPGFALLIVAIVVAGMIGLLVLNTTLQNQGFEVRRAQRQAAELAYQVSDLETRVHQAASPAMVAGRATELGMVPNPNGVFIDLGTGRVVGTPRAATGLEVPSLRVPRPTAPIAPADLHQVTTHVVGWFDLEGVQPPAPTAPPPGEVPQSVAAAAPAPAVPAAPAPAAPAPGARP